MHCNSFHIFEFCTLFRAAIFENFGFAKNAQRDSGATPTRLTLRKGLWLSILCPVPNGGPKTSPGFPTQRPTLCKLTNSAPVISAGWQN